MRTFFAPNAYRFGPIAAAMAVGYLGFTALLLIGTIREGVGDGAFMIGFSWLATLPWSYGVMEAYSAIESAHGVPMAEQDGACGWCPLSSPAPWSTPC